jgi:hypothetical protein
MGLQDRITTKYLVTEKGENKQFGVTVII